MGTLEGLEVGLGFRFATLLPGDFTSLRAESSSGRPPLRATFGSVGFATHTALPNVFSLSSFAFKLRYAPYISFTPGAAAASSFVGCRPCVLANAVSQTFKSRRVFAIRDTRSPSLDGTSPPGAPAFANPTSPREASIAAVALNAPPVVMTTTSSLPMIGTQFEIPACLASNLGTHNFLPQSRTHRHTPRRFLRPGVGRGVPHGRAVSGRARGCVEHVRRGTYLAVLS